MSESMVIDAEIVALDEGRGNELVLQARPFAPAELDKAARGAQFFTQMAPDRLRTRQAYLEREARWRNEIEQVEAAHGLVAATIDDYERSVAEFVAEAQRQATAYFAELDRLRTKGREEYDKDLTRLARVKANRLRMIEIGQLEYRTADRVQIAWRLAENRVACPFCDQKHELPDGLAFTPCRVGAPVAEHMVYVASPDPSTSIGQTVLRIFDMREVCEAALKNGDRCDAKGRQYVDASSRKAWLCTRHIGRLNSSRELSFGLVARVKCPRSWVRLSALVGEPETISTQVAGGSHA